MIRNAKIPHELSNVLGSESRDFIVEAKRAYPITNSFSLVFFGLMWTGITGIIAFAFFGPIFKGNESHFSINGVATTASLDNMEPLLFPGVFLSLFILVGIGFLIAGFYKIFKKGGFFVGTPTRLVCYLDGKIRSIDWEQFTGDIKFTGSDQNGVLSLVMRTGKMVSRQNQSSKYVPEVVYMVGISNAFRVEKVCRQRIKENDPTPVNSFE